MYQTQYNSLQTIGRSFAPYIGGICKFWYTPIENLNGFPVIDPSTQKLSAEPVLLGDRNWYGPVNIPDKQMGYTEDNARTTAGLYYKRKLTGFIPGHDAGTHINTGNMALHQFCIVAKLRAGGFFIVAGNDQAGLDFDESYLSGSGANETPGTKISFSDEAISKAFALDSFLGENAVQPINYSIITTQSDMETIDFNDAGDTVIDWTINNRITRFGHYPTIEVWPLNDATGNYYKGNFAIDAIGDPPTSFIIRNAGGHGKIKIM